MGAALGASALVVGRVYPIAVLCTVASSCSWLVFLRRKSLMIVLICVCGVCVGGRVKKYGGQRSTDLASVSVMQLARVLVAEVVDGYADLCVSVCVCECIGGGGEGVKGAAGCGPRTL